MDTTNTFAEISAQWIEEKRRLVKHSSFCAYNLILQTHLLPCFSEHSVIQEREVQQFVFDKLAAGLSRMSVKNILATLKSIIHYGQKHFGLVQEEWDISFPTETIRKGLPVLSISNHRKLIKHLCKIPTAQNIGILLALCTGMRIGEICALKWSDINMANRTITICHTLGRIYNVEKKVTERILTSPKTKTSNRIIPISKELHAALRVVKSGCTNDTFVVGGTLTPKEPRCYREYFSRVLSRLGIPRIVFHGLRHTFATRCIECMCDYKTVSVILGHSNVATTMNLYVHPNQDQKKRCIDKLSRFMCGTFAQEFET